jgi:hypothetical protein
MRTSVIRVSRLSVFLLLLITPGLSWADEDFSTWTLEALESEKEYLESQIEYCNAGIEAYDALIAAMTDGQIGGDMPSSWDPYPEDMTEAQFEALLQTFEQYKYWIVCCDPEVVETYLCEIEALLTQRRQEGDPERNATGPVSSPFNNNALDSFVQQYVFFGNQLMDQLMADEPRLAAIKAEIARRAAGAVVGGAAIVINPM